MIEYRAFSKRYGRQPAVTALDLRIERGEALALLGPNGSGKTTALKAAAGLIHPTAGDVLIGEAARPALLAEARRILSFLPQRVTFPESLTGRETLEFHRALRGAAGERIDRVLQFAALNGAGERMVGTYSGGMVQRLGLAVTLLPDAPVLLLDEPTAALDPDGLCAFYGVVHEHRREGKTIVFTSHQLGDVERLADRIAVLVGGRLVATLTARELADRLADRGVLRLRVSGVDGAALERLRRVAPRATWSGEELVVPGPSASRPAALEALRDAGATVHSISTQEGRLGALYAELTQEAG